MSVIMCLILGGLRGLNFLLPNFCTFLNWYLICYQILHFSQMVPFFSQISNTVFKATFYIGTFWRQKVKRGLNFWVI